MDQASSPPGHRDFEIDLPQISRTLLDELADHLRDVCFESVGDATGDRRGAVVEVEAQVCGPLLAQPLTSSDLDDALSTVTQAATLMSELRGMASPDDDVRAVAQGLTLLRTRLSQSEAGISLLSQQLLVARSDAEDQARRRLEAEKHLDSVVAAVIEVFGSLSPTAPSLPIAGDG